MPFISRPDIKSASLASVTLLYIHENEKKDSQEEEEEKKKHKKCYLNITFARFFNQHVVPYSCMRA